MAPTKQSLINDHRDQIEQFKKDMTLPDKDRSFSIDEYKEKIAALEKAIAALETETVTA